MCYRPGGLLLTDYDSESAAAHPGPVWSSQLHNSTAVPVAGHGARSGQQAGVGAARVIRGHTPSGGRLVDDQELLTPGNS